MISVFHKNDILLKGALTATSKRTPRVQTKPLALEAKNKIRQLIDKGWSSEKICRRFHKYTPRQVSAVKGWMRRRKYT